MRPPDQLNREQTIALVGARRKLISELRAPEAELLAEVGDYLVMGRVEAQFDWELHPMFSLTSNLWFERAWVGLSFHLR